MSYTARPPLPLVVLPVALLLAGGCMLDRAGAAGPDGALPDSALLDAFVPAVDGGGIDAGSRDAGARDAGPRDASVRPDADRADAFVPRDAGPPDAGPPDAGPPALLGCAETYGRVMGGGVWTYQLCMETPTHCRFYIDPPGNDEDDTCENVCELVGGTCDEAREEGDGDACAYGPTALPCTEDANDQVCLCTRIPVSP